MKSSKIEFLLKKLLKLCLVDRLKFGQRQDFNIYDHVEEEKFFPCDLYAKTSKNWLNISHMCTFFQLKISIFVLRFKILSVLS